MLLRAWLFVGLIAATLQMSAYFYVLLDAGWHPGDPSAPASRSITPTCKPPP